jgi:hypothetical protein
MGCPLGLRYSWSQDRGGAGKGPAEYPDWELFIVFPILAGRALMKAGTIGVTTHGFLKINLFFCFPEALQGFMLPGEFFQQ